MRSADQAPCGSCISKRSGWDPSPEVGKDKDGVELGEKATQGGTTYCVGKAGHWGGKFKKHVSHTLKAESWAESHTSGETIVLAKDYVMRSQAPVFDVWLLTVSEPPHPSLFLSCPQQLIRQPGCSLSWGGWRFKHSQ